MVAPPAHPVAMKGLPEDGDLISWNELYPQTIELRILEDDCDLKIFEFEDDEGLRHFLSFHRPRSCTANTGKIEAVVELKSNADKYWGSLRDSTNLFPRAFPHDYKSIEVLEGDGKSAGSIRHITYAEGSLLAKNSTEKIEAVDDEKKWVAYSVIGEDLMKYYKSFKGEFSVTPKGEGSVVKWSCEYEKAHEEVPDPTVIRDFAIKNFKEVDEYVLMDNPSA